MALPAAGPIAIFGLPIANLPLQAAIERIQAFIAAGRPVQIVAADGASISAAVRNKVLQRILCDCAMVFAAEAPVLWAARLCGLPARAGITGLELLHALAQLSADQNVKVFLLGSQPTVALSLAEALRRTYPQANIAGSAALTLHPPDVLATERVLDRIAAARPSILLVDVQSPLQLLWIHRHRAMIEAPVVISLRGAFAGFVHAQQRPAPVIGFVGRAFALVPLSLRGVGETLSLMLHLAMAYLIGLLQPQSSSNCLAEPAPSKIRQGLRVLATPANLSGTVCQWLLRESSAAVAAGQSVILDLSATIRIEPDGLGALLESRRLLLAAGLRVWLAGLSNPVRRLLQFFSVDPLFRLAANPEQAIDLTIAAHPRPLSTLWSSHHSAQSIAHSASSSA